MQLHHGSAKRHHPLGEIDGPHGVLIVPGFGSCGRWPTAWERLPHFHRVELDDGSAPKLDEWVFRLDRAVRESARPIILVGHGLGCNATAAWATISWSEAFREKVCGALLVAPLALDDEAGAAGIDDFRDVPPTRLPFPSIVVAGRETSDAQIEQLARIWGSDLIEAGASGDPGGSATAGAWAEGLPLPARLSGHNANLLVAELGLRTAFG